MTLPYNHDERMDVLGRNSGPIYGYDGQDGAEFDVWQRTLREELAETLGFPAIRSVGPCDLDPRLIETASEDGYERQKWTVRTEPDFRVPFYLLLPDDRQSPAPVVVAIHGHTDIGKDLAVGDPSTDEHRAQIADERRDIARQAVRRGYAVLAPDMRGFGELRENGRESDRGGACREMQLHAQLFGRSLAGERTWDVLKLLEFVDTRPGLDDDRLAITGHSGGGAVTLYAAALEERFSVVAPNAYFCTFEDSIIEHDHCECNYVPGVRRLGEMSDIAGLVAPRPLLIATGNEDPIFPIDGTRRAFEKLRERYRAAGAPDECELSVGDGGHRFYDDGVWPFVGAHL